MLQLQTSIFIEKSILLAKKNGLYYVKNKNIFNLRKVLETRFYYPIGFNLQDVENLVQIS